MLSYDLHLWGNLCLVASKNDDLSQLQEFTRRIGSRLLEGAERAQGMEAMPVCTAVAEPVYIDLSDEKIIPFPKANLRVVPINDGGAA
jgi:hypothetical protein